MRALDPSLELIAPARDWEMSRSDEIEYARVRNIPVPVTIASPYSVDSNLWGRSIECGVLEDAWAEPPAEIYTLTRPAQQCPDEPAYIDIEFERGVPVRANGIDMMAPRIAPPTAAPPILRALSGPGDSPSR